MSNISVSTSYGNIQSKKNDACMSPMSSLLDPKLSPPLAT